MAQLPDRSQFNSVTQLCLTLCDTVDCSTPGFPDHHQLPELAQTHVHRVGDTILSTHPLLSPSPPAFNLSQHQGLFQWVGSSHQVAKVLGLQLRHPSFNEYSGLISFKIDWFDLLAVQGTQEYSSAPQFKSINSSVLSLLYGPTLKQVSVQFSRSVVSNSLRPHGLQHTRLPWPSPTPRVYSNSCPSSQRCYPTISSSVVPFSSCLQSFPAPGSFQIEGNAN